MYNASVLVDTARLSGQSSMQSSTMQNQIAPFNQDEALKSLREKFSRLIPKLGANNSRGTKRYGFEVEFCYAVRELENCPPYLTGKLFDRVANVCNALAQTIKTDSPQAA